MSQNNELNIKDATEFKTTLTEKVELEVIHKRAKNGRGFMPVQGWHPNYLELKITKESGEEISGSITFINGKINTVIGGKDSFSFDIVPFINKLIEENIKE